MRSIRHWKPRYIVDRLQEIYYQKKFPAHPWLTPVANEILESLIKPNDSGLELGSGRSTVWFSKRVSHLTSIEHDVKWYKKVNQTLIENGIDNVDYILMPKDQDETYGDEAQYVQTVRNMKPGSFDFALVDGVYRDYCALHAITKIRSNGWLVIDNVNWYLPSESRSPNSRTLSQGPKGPIWEKVSNELANWRHIWTSSGVTDTAFYFRPE
jgi:predicted O-methyltransferase YrrM